MTLLTPHPPVVTAVFRDNPDTMASALGRYVHMTLSLIADENGHVETTVHTLEHMTGLQPTVIEAALGFNPAERPLFTGTVTLVDGIITADLPTGA